MLSLPPKDVVAILRSACVDPPDPRLSKLLEEFKTNWLKIACKRYPILQTRGLTEDVIQNAFIKILAKITQLRDEASVEAWCRAIFINAAMDLIGSDVIVPDEMDPPEEQIEIEKWLDEVTGICQSTSPTQEDDYLRKEQLTRRQKIVKTVFQRLSTRHKKIFLLKFLEELSDKKIAELLEMSPIRVRHVATEIRRKCRQEEGAY